MEAKYYVSSEPCRKGFEYLIPEWLGRRIRDAAGRIYNRFDIYGY